jgi:small subunit ribosomal protein S6e
MAVFKFVVADPETRKTYQLEIDQDKAVGLIGKKIGDKFNGDILGLPGYEIQITGGTDKDGFPMHPHVHGPGKKKVLLAGPPGFHPRLKGQRKKKTVRGNVISRDIVQINCKIIKKGAKPIEELISKKPKEKEVEEVPKEEEKPSEKPEKKEEAPREEKEEPSEKKEEKLEKQEGK